MPRPSPSPFPTNRPNFFVAPSTTIESLKNSSTRCELLASRCSSTPSKDPHVEKEEYHPKCALSSRHSGLAMTSALCGVPYNPGDNQENVDQYVERLWSSWIVNGTAPGSQATMQPADQATSVLNFLHTLDVYGPPDWSIYAKAVNAKGEEVDDIVFTAAFSKIDEDTKEVITTFVAFNPTWKPCYVHFVRIRSDGTLSDVPIHLRCDEKGRTTPIQVEPKKMTVLNSPWMGTA